MDSILVYLMKEYSAIVESSEINKNREHKISFRMCFIKWKKIEFLHKPIANAVKMVQLWEQAMTPECMKLQQSPAKWNTPINFLRKWKDGHFCNFKNETL